MDVEAFENFVNEQIPEVLFDSKDAPQMENITVLAKKWGKIRVRAKDNAYFYLVPVQIHVEKNVAVTNVKADCIIILGMKTQFLIGENWELKTKTEIEKYEWKEKPVAKVGIIPLPVESIILDNLMGNKDLITGSIDRQIQEKINFSRIINENINRIPNPVLPPFGGKIWWRLSPGQTYMDPLRMDQGRIKFNLGLKTDAELFIAENFDKQPLQINPPEVIAELDKLSQLHVKSEISLADLNSMVNAQVLNKEFAAAGQKLMVKELKVSSENGALVVQGETKGGFSGDAYLKAIPAFDNTTKELFVKDVKLKLNGSDFLSKGIAMVLQNKAGDMIEKGLRYSLKEVVGKLNEEMNSIEIHPGIFLRTHVTDYTLTNFEIGTDKVLFSVLIEGVLALQIKQLNLPEGIIT